ncbi:MAG TPA: D-2-hydroxyacid dehydrogenase [Firmicutes bacterium]|nr:D-2-hydroxyacid dehydrogenase [Bacillota bacterium]
MLVASTVKIKPDKLEALKKEFPGVEIAVSEDLSALRDRWGGIEALVTFVGDELTPEFLAAAGRLRWVQLFAAGADRLPFAELKRRGILISNVSGIHKTSMTEQAFAYMLNFVRRTREFLEAQKRREWQRPKGFFAFTELKGKTLVVVGAGHIGQEIGRLGQAFGMRTVGVNSDGRPAEYFEVMYPTSRRTEALAEGDFIVVVVPLTPATHRLIGAAELAALKPSAFFINIARGPVVDQEALIAALREGRLAGAGLDVFTPEPLPADSPLWDLPNVFITPHIAGWAADYNDNCLEVFRTNLKLFLAGQPLSTPVDPDLGY